MALRAPNGPEGFITTFKDIGTMIAVYDEYDTGDTNSQTKVVAAVEQMDYDFGTVKSLATFINNTAAAASNLATAKTNVVSAVTNYVTTVLKVDIDSTSTTASGILADLGAVMASQTAGASAPSGLRILDDGGFDTFLLTHYGAQLPVTSGAVYLSQTESMDLISGLVSKPSAQRQIDDSYTY